MDDMDSAAIGSVTNYGRLTDLLRDGIIEGKLKPRDRLKVQDLAKQYGVSVAPIREALHQLHSEGLVVLLPNKGAIVRELNLKQFTHMMNIRAAIDAAQARLCCELNDNKLIDELDALAHEYSDEIKRDELREEVNINRKFHDAINGCDGNKEAIAITGRISAVTAALRRAYTTDLSQRSQAAEGHLAIVAALRAKNPDEAAKLAAHHVQMTRDDIVAFLS